MRRMVEATLAVTMLFATSVGCGSDTTSAAGPSEDPKASPEETGGEDDARPDPSAPGKETSCPAGKWNHDGDSSTPCVAWTTCKAGTFVTNTPSEIVDRACAACSQGTYSATSNAASCQSWTECDAKDLEWTPGTSMNDRACAGISWARQFGTTARDDATSMRVDGNGNVYVAGTTFGVFPGLVNEGGSGGFLRKYDGTGKELWTRQFGTDQDDDARSVSVDENGNVYVTGITKGVLPGQKGAGKRDAYIRKYDGTGKELWTRQFGTDDDDDANDVSVDGKGNVYVAGATRGAFPGGTVGAYHDENPFLRKYDGAGKELWTRQFGTTSNDSAKALSIDDSGNVYVAGIEGFSYSQIFVRKFDGTGKELWARQFGSPNKSNDVDAVLVDGGGNLYVTGYAGGTIPGQTSAGGFDAYVRKYDGTGKDLWTQQFGSKGIDVAYSLSMDGSGNLYVAGVAGGALPGQKGIGEKGAPFLRKYDGAGKELWTRQFGTGAFVAVHAEKNGGFYLAGTTSDVFPGQKNMGDFDAFLLRLNP